MSATIPVGVLQAILELRDNLSPAIATVRQNLKATGTDMLAVGQTIAPLSLALTGVGLAGVKMATDLNRSMANVASLIPGNTQRINELKASVQSMAIETGKSTADLSDGLYNVISAFGDTADTVAILDTNARAAAAGLATTTDAINLTSAVTKGYGDTSAAAVAQASDLALLTVRLGQTTFPELAASIGRVTPLSAALKVSQEELFGVMATFTGVTGGAAEVSTQLRGVLQSLMAPTDDMQALFAKLGVSSGSAAIEQFGLQGVIQKVVAEAEAAGAPLQEYLSSIEGQTLALAASGGQAATFTEKIAAMREAAGTTAVAFKEQTEGANAAGHAWETFKQEMVVAMQQFGDVILPVLAEAGTAMRPAVSAVLDLVKGFAELPGPVKTAGVVLGALLAAAGPLLLTFGAIATSITALMPVFSMLGTGLAILTGPIGLVVAAVVGLTAAWMTWGDDITRVVSETYTAIKTWLWDKLEPVLTPLIGLAGSIGEAWDAFALLMSAIGARVVSTVAAWVSEVIGWLRDKLQPVFAPIGAAMDTLAGVFTRVKDAVVSTVTAMYEGVKTWMLDRFTGIVDSIKGKVDAVTGFFKDMYVAVVGNSYVPDMVTGIAAEFAKLQGAMVAPAQAAGAAVELVFKNLSAAAANMGQTIVGALQGGGNVLQSLFGSLGAGAGKDVGDWLTKAFGGGTIGKALGSFAGPLGALAGSAVGDLMSKIGGLFGGNDAKAAREQAAKLLGFGSLDAMYSALRSLGEDELVHEALNLIGKKDISRNNEWLRSVTEIFHAQRAAAEDAAGAVAAATNAMLNQAAAVGAALHSLPTDIDFNIRPHVDRHGNLTDDSGLPQFSKGTNGFEYFGSGTKVMLHGWEKVVPYGAPESGSTSVNVTFTGPLSVRDDSDIDAIADAVIVSLYDRGIVS